MKLIWHVKYEINYLAINHRGIIEFSCAGDKSSSAVLIMEFDEFFKGLNKNNDWWNEKLVYL